MRKLIQYPDSAYANGIEGEVIFEVIVNEEGRIEYITLVSGIGWGCDEEALRVLREARFTPALSQGTPVKVRMHVPVVFDMRVRRRRFKFWRR